MLKIKIIVGSTRPNRFGIQPAEWLLGLANERGDAEYELVDLQKVALPFLDEPKQPSDREYVHEHTKQWSKLIDGSDGFVLVTPEYNHSMPPSLKNALDFLWWEWNYKPLAFVSYGGESGGLRAVEQLRSMAAAFKMYDLREQVALTRYEQFLDESGKFQPNEYHIKAAGKLLDQLVFWAGKMQAARAELKAKQ